MSQGEGTLGDSDSDSPNIMIGSKNEAGCEFPLEEESIRQIFEGS
jgi:hypothetical protein